MAPAEDMPGIRPPAHGDFAVLHYATIDAPTDENPEAQLQVARVRMFVGRHQYDEDLILPRPITIEEQLEQLAKARITEIEDGVNHADSKIVLSHQEEALRERVATDDEGNVIAAIGRVHQ